jgi:Xaa-Pro aminopeptidase
MRRAVGRGPEAMATPTSTVKTPALMGTSAPLITRAEYQRRRRRLLAALGPEAVAILTAAPERVRNGHTHYPYRQASDFTYLTGFPEPEALLALIPGRQEGEVVFFCRPRDPEKEVWEGARAGVEGAVAVYGADQAHPITALDEELPKLVADRDQLHYPLAREADLDLRVMGWIQTLRAQARSGVRAPEALVNLEALLHEQRLIKDKTEIKLMRRAARVSAAAHRRVMRFCQPGRWEFELEAEFSRGCAEGGARFQAYPPIVGGGANACVLHYADNAARLQDGDLVLIDAGAELDGYASDITRTYPVNGRFSQPQRELYELVLAAQAAAIAKVAPGNRWIEPHEAAVKILTRGLVELGLLPGGPKAVPKLIRDQAYKPYFMHRTGHWLGMDVHDVGDYKRDGDWRRFEPGMALTVEPGLYVAPGRQEAPKRFRGIGIRIEDDLVVTAGGHEVLSRQAPKTVAEIEAWMGGGQGLA